MAAAAATAAAICPALKVPEASLAASSSEPAVSGSCAIEPPVKKVAAKASK